MSAISKFNSTKKVSIKNFNPKAKISENGSFKNEEITTVFRDLHISALSKAVTISPEVKSVTLGSNFSPKVEEEVSENENAVNTEETSSQVSEESKIIFGPSLILSSTPEKSDKSNSFNFSKCTKIKQNLNASNQNEFNKKSNLDNCFSYRTLLSELDNQRRLTVDKVMRERIQNMYDTGKLIRDSLEHIKQTRQEEVLARRLFLERKILDDIHEQETLNKPKREAQLAKDNLKEAQRIQERNQKVKEAEEEARKKSEAILLKRKQIDKILTDLQKEYNVEYKNMLEAIKSCKDKSVLTDLTASHSKILKEYASAYEGLLKKCKQGGVNEEDVEKAKKLMETIKSMEKFTNEIKKINEASTKAEEDKTENAPKIEKEASSPKKQTSESAVTSSSLSVVSASSIRALLQLNFIDMEVTIKDLIQKN